VRICPLKHARAEELASLIDRTLEGSVQVTADSRTNSLVFSGTAEGTKQIVELLEQLDIPDRGQQPKGVTMVIPIKNRPAADALSVAQGLVLDKMRSKLIAVPDTQSNSIIAQGTREDLEELSKFLMTYDVPAGEPASAATETVLLQPTYRRATELLDLLKPVSSRAASISIDPERQTIVVHGPKSQVQTISEVFERLDQPQPSLGLSFYFITSGGPVFQTLEVPKGAMKGRDADDKATEKKQVKVSVVSPSLLPGAVLMAQPLPKELEPVVAELADKGFEQAALLAAVVVRTEASAKFNASGALAGSAGVGLNVSGRASLEKDKKLAHLQIQANVTGEKLRSPKGQRFALFEVETAVTAPLGDYVILASAPSGAGTGESIAVVLRADAD
jgi:hypothetical protein